MSVVLKETVESFNTATVIKAATVSLTHGRRVCQDCGLVGRVMAAVGAVITCPHCGGATVPSSGPEDYR